MRPEARTITMGAAPTALGAVLAFAAATTPVAAIAPDPDDAPHGASPPASARAGTIDAEYAVLLARSADPEFRPAAERLAAMHGAAVELFDATDLDSLKRRLCETKPRHAVFVMAPASIDVQFAQDLLERLVSLDDDPFLDVRYGFVTGRDGAAAERFVAAIETARSRAPTGKALMFGSWEGPQLPPKTPLSSLAALGLDGRSAFVLVKDPAESRERTTRDTLAGAGDFDLLLLFSHGYPDRMEACFSGKQLREWSVRLPPSLVVNCACWNGCPGRWWMPGPGGFEERPAPALDASVALAMLDTGIAAYVAGVDPWHGPLANQVTMQLAERGLSLGDASKAMIDRLALDFAPEPIRFGKVADRTMTGEGRDHRRRNAAAMIVYGDPSWAPFGASAPRLLRVERSGGAADANTDGGSSAAAPVRVTIECRPLVKGMPGDDFILAHSRLLDYHSVRTNEVFKELSLEVVGAVDWPEPLPANPQLRVIEATSGDAAIETREPQWALETDGAARRLHVRVPLAIRAYGDAKSFMPAMRGVRVTLEQSPQPSR